ncbi:MAG: SDR family oxidoreductase [Pseudomarimonas sp.]
MQNVLIAGGNRGIGLALAEVHARRGDHVIAACRQSSTPLQDLGLLHSTADRAGVRIEAGVDVTHAATLTALADRLQDCQLDRLVVCAGVLSRESLDDLGDDASVRIRRQFEVNALAPLRVVASLLPRMATGSKIGILTSRMGSMGDNTSGGYYGYRMSKAAVNAAGRSLAHDLAPRGIAVFLLHPGFVRTEMTAGNGDVSAAQSAANLVQRMDELSFADSGGFWHANGDELPW